MSSMGVLTPSRLSELLREAEAGGQVIEDPVLRRILAPDRAARREDLHNQTGC